MRPPILPKQISKQIWVNGIIDLEAATFLKKQGVTDILSLVGAYPQQKKFASLGMKIINIPLNDRQALRMDQVLPIMCAIDDALAEKDARIYIHCHAGQLRAPTITWLYLIYSGSSESYASSRLFACGEMVPARHLVQTLDLVALRNARKR